MRMPAQLTKRGMDDMGRRVVRDAAVELHGRVGSPAERRAAKRAVRQVLGDVPLDCQLVIRGRSALDTKP